MFNLAPQIRCDPFQPANRDRLAVHAASTARRLARTVAGAAQNRREHIRLPVEHVGIRIAAVRNQTNIFRNVGVRGAGPLAIDNFMEVLRILCVGRFHARLWPSTWLPSCSDGILLYALQNVTGDFSILRR